MPVEHNEWRLAALRQARRVSEIAPTEVRRIGYACARAIRRELTKPFLPQRVEPIPHPAGKLLEAPGPLGVDGGHSAGVCVGADRVR
jgi:hypothetical protein